MWLLLKFHCSSQMYGYEILRKCCIVIELFLSYEIIYWVLLLSVTIPVPCFTWMRRGCFSRECLWCVAFLWARFMHDCCCVLKCFVPLPCHTPAARLGVNMPCFCSSACSPEGRKPELQLEVLIKAFSGDYAAGLPGFRAGEVFGERLSLKCLYSEHFGACSLFQHQLQFQIPKRGLAPALQHVSIKENIYYLLFFQLLMNTDFSSLHDFSLLQNSTNIYYHDTH